MTERRLSPAEIREWWAKNRQRYATLDHEDAVARGQVYHTTHQRKRNVFGLPPMSEGNERRYGRTDDATD